MLVGDDEVEGGLLEQERARERAGGGATAAAGAFPRMTKAFLMCFQTMKKTPS